MKTVRYEGERTFNGPRVFTINEHGERRLLARRVTAHMPPGFDWGHGGSGPSDLALNLLADAVGDDGLCERCHGRGTWRSQRCPDCRGLKISDTIWRAHYPFKRDYIAGLPDRWSLERADVMDWLARLEVVA